jgi:hypothetical protein
LRSELALEDRSVSALIRVALQHYLAEIATGSRRETMLQEPKATRAGIGDFHKMETLT